MSTLTILEFPDDRLRTIAKPVTMPDSNLSDLAQQMGLVMYAAPGIGLAATQVDQPYRLFVMDLSEAQDSLEIFFNPVILEGHGDTNSDEGCLSVPGFYENVERAEQILLRWHNDQGEVTEQRFTGMAAICIQHEIDHLDGKLFVDHISKLKRDRIRKKLVKIKRQAELA
ncbi:MAG: peptide deformylase [Immundisolibacteraceae bacterium]|nr:peptide deformylase [Immundisolibacteraceae bacterium]